MVPVVPALVVFVAQASAPRYFTNAENVRRIAAGKRYVAFATSGGVRIFERATQKWRVYTQNDGLPTHNIHDIVFDKEKPDTLWVLCGSWGDWAIEQPEPNLRLVTLELASGKIETIAPPTPAPRTARMGYLYFLDYRLSLSEGWAFVFTDKGASLVWDRMGKKWSRDLSVAATPSRASFYPGHASRLNLVGISGSTLAFLVQTSLPYITQSHVIPGNNGEAPRVMNQLVPMGEGLPPHVLLYDRATGRSTRHPLGQDLMGVSTVVPGAKGTTPKVINSGRPQWLVPDTRPGAFLIESVAFEVTTLPEGKSTINFTLVHHRVSPDLTEPVEISREPIAQDQLAQRTQRGNFVPLTFCTDFLLEGNTLWVTGYNDPGRARSGGIARLDLTTGKWEGPKPAAIGLPANFVTTRVLQDQLRVMGGYGQWMFDPSGESGGSRFSNETSYNPATEEFERLPPPPNSVSRPFLGGRLLDPRVQAEPGKVFEWAMLQVLGSESASQVLVLGTAEPTRQLVQENGSFKMLSVKYDTYFLYNLLTKQLTKLSVRGLENLQPKSAGFGERSLFFLTEQRAPGERRGAPVVVRWDTKTGVVKRYPEPLFRDVSIAAQRAAGVRQQTDLKRRQKEREALLKRFPTLPPQPPVALRPPMEFLWPLSGSFLKAAGTTWLQLDQHLFRYDSRQDTWMPEGLADSLSPEGETALWKQAGPEWWRFEGFEARRLRGELSRWTLETGWQKLELGESARQAGYGLLFHDDALWLTGVGALRLPRSAWTFQK